MPSSQRWTNQKSSDPSSSPEGERNKQEGKLTVTNHLYQRHLSLEDYPSCKLCQFTSYQKAKFTKHGEWYLGDKMMQVGDGPEPPVSSYLQVWDNTTMLEEMLVVCLSRSFWSTGSRRGAQPAFRPLIVPVLLASAEPPLCVFSATCDLLHLFSPVLDVGPSSPAALSSAAIPPNQFWIPPF